jgi:hypothetical protein
VNWTYRRGRWTASLDYPRTIREELAAERNRKWGWQHLWKKFPQLGPIPEKWMDVGPAPKGLSAINELLIEVYSPAIRHMLNQPSPLMAFLEKR